MKSTKSLSKLVDTYINAHYGQTTTSKHGAQRSALRQFHRWLESEQLTFSDLNQYQFTQFDQTLIKKGLQRTTRTTIRVYLQKYFVWLYKKNILKVDPKLIFPRMRTRKKLELVLPKRAQRFICLVETQYKPNTAKSCKSILRCFYDFMNRHNIKLQRLGRSHIEKFMFELKDNGLSESTRAARLIYVRIYLRWLHENNFFKFNPDHLIRNRDIPKIPRKLPRYLPHGIDSKLQKRLSESEDIFYCAFLLMRSTCIRIGELKSLKFNCIRENGGGQYFLKVELGKLDTERLVPIDAKTLELIHNIQNKSQQYCHNPELLIYHPSGKRPLMNHFYAAFYDITKGLESDGPIVPHQMRHTYATEMLNAGMPMPALREILGHKSFVMVSHYAKVTLQTVIDEYLKASKVYQQKYILKKIESIQKDDPLQILSDLILVLNKQKSKGNINRRNALNLITRRLKRIEGDLLNLK